MAREIRGISPSGTLYARIMNEAGLWWNGSSFELYASASWANYVVTMTRQGSSAISVADFPAGITATGKYEFYVHRQVGGSPAETDVQIVNIGKHEINTLQASTVTELSAVPAASPTPAQALMFLYMALRNRQTTTSTQTTIQNDAGTAIATATISDDGSQATKGEFA